MGQGTMGGQTDAADLGLSQLHISQPSPTRGRTPIADALSGALRGECRSDEPTIPCNGWSWPESTRGICLADDPSTGRRFAGDDRGNPGNAPGEARPGDILGTVRRTIDTISVGRVPVLHGVRTRGRINRFTGGSCSRLVAFLRECDADYRFLGTLTVGASWTRDGAEFKACLDKYLCWFMRAQQRAASESGLDPATVSLLWFLEFQRRGAPHVHFLYTHRIPWRDAAIAWANAINDPSIALTSTKFERIRAGRSGILAYVRKYAAKLEQKEVPSDYQFVGRFWGVRGLRTRVTCHVVLPGTARGNEMVLSVEALCERYYRQGKLRRWRWAEGDGFIYAAIRGETLYSLGIGQEFDLLIMRYAVGLRPREEDDGATNG